MIQVIDRVPHGGGRSVIIVKLTGHSGPVDQMRDKLDVVDAIGDAKGRRLLLQRADCPRRIAKLFEQVLGILPSRGTARLRGASVASRRTGNTTPRMFPCTGCSK